MYNAGKTINGATSLHGDAQVYTFSASANFANRELPLNGVFRILATDEFKKAGKGKAELANEPGLPSALYVDLNELFDVTTGNINPG